MRRLKIKINQNNPRVPSIRIKNTFYVDSEQLRVVKVVFYQMEPPQPEACVFASEVNSDSIKVIFCVPSSSVSAISISSELGDLCCIESPVLSAKFEGEDVFCFCVFTSPVENTKFSLLHFAFLRGLSEISPDPCSPRSDCSCENLKSQVMLALDALGLNNLCDVFQVNGLFGLHTASPLCLDPIDDLKQQRIVIPDRPLLAVSDKDVNIILQNIGIFFNHLHDGDDGDAMEGAA